MNTGLKFRYRHFADCHSRECLSRPVTILSLLNQTMDKQVTFNENDSLGELLLTPPLTPNEVFPPHCFGVDDLFMINDGVTTSGATTSGATTSGATTSGATTLDDIIPTSSGGPAPTSTFEDYFVNKIPPNTSADDLEKLAELLLVQAKDARVREFNDLVAAQETVVKKSAQKAEKSIAQLDKDKQKLANIITGRDNWLRFKKTPTATSSAVVGGPTRTRRVEK